MRRRLLDSTTPAPWPARAPPLLTILLGKHGGRTYPQAVAVAQQARRYQEQVEGASVHHVATFERTAPQAAAAVRLLELTLNLKGSVVFDGAGVMVPSKHKALGVLDCYRKACLCDDDTAHCHVVINDPFTHRGAFGLGYLHDRQSDRYLLPCRLINKAYLAFDLRHPAGYVDLIQAAVSNGSQWCPNFEPESFRPLLAIADDRRPA